MNAQERLQKVIRAALAMQRWPWEQGVVAQGLMELGESELTILMAAEAVVNQHKDGRLAMKYDRSTATDPSSNGEPVLFAARATGDARFTSSAERMRDYLLYRAPRTRQGIIFHHENQGQIWVDSLFMAPPFLAAAGCPEEAVKQVLGYRTILWDPAARLFRHQWDEDLQVFSRGLFWGVGNGWAAAGMARVIRLLPGSMAEAKHAIAGFVRELLDGCLARRRTDALFHDIVDDPSTFVETNLSQMLAYTIFRGAAEGWLDRGYLSHAEAMRDAVITKIDDRGLVQGVCAAPTFDYPGTAPEGQAFFLLMEAAYRDLTAR